MLERFATHVRSFINADGLRPLKVIADTANGMGGLVVPASFEGLPFELEVLFGELDGTFPNILLTRSRSRIWPTCVPAFSRPVPTSA